MSVQFSCSVVPDSLQPLGLEHTRLPCPSPTSRACSNSCPLSQWCWSWSSSTLTTSCEELTHWRRPWCLERLKAGEGDDRGCVSFCTKNTDLKTTGTQVVHHLPGLNQDESTKIKSYSNTRSLNYFLKSRGLPRPHKRYSRQQMHSSYRIPPTFQFSKPQPLGSLFGK